MSASKIKRIGETNRERLVRWQEFQQWLDNHSDSRWVFRGLGDTDFGLLPSVGRRSNYNLAYEQSILELFKLRAPEFVALGELQTLDLLAIAQHHGVPTRLLDWTSNPLVAAYFAITADPGKKSAKMILANGRASRTASLVQPVQDDVDAKVIAVRVSQNVKVRPDADPFALSDVSFVWPRAVTTRITDQGGLFSIHPAPNVPWTPQDPRGNHTFVIPSDMRKFFAKRLFYLGINPQRIMGGLDGIGARLAWQYERGVGLGTY